MVMQPEASFPRPLRVDSRVVFPDPEGPMIPRTCPARAYPVMSWRIKSFGVVSDLSLTCLKAFPKGRRKLEEHFFSTGILTVMLLKAKSIGRCEEEWSTWGEWWWRFGWVLEFGREGSISDLTCMFSRSVKSCLLDNGEVDVEEKSLIWMSLEEDLRSGKEIHH